MPLSKDYWDSLYTSKKTGWDIGYISTPIKEYFDQVNNKLVKILIIGAGRAWEAEYLYKNGFVNTYILDFSKEVVGEFKKRCPWFPANQIIIDDFFEHTGKYDLIVEQTFFSSFKPEQRQQYVKKIYNLLNNKGKYVGLLFNHEFDFGGPPFGGTIQEYNKLFKPYFHTIVFETAYNSIKPRTGKEIFMILKIKN